MQSIKIIFRHLIRQRLNSILHIVGLALGMSVCLLIGLFLRYELSFDNYHKLSDRIYRINSLWNNGGKVTRWYPTPLPLAEALRKESTGIEKVTMFHPQEPSVIDVGSGERFSQENILIVDSDFPDVFDVNILRGDLRKTLSQPYQAALTQSTAKKYFGNEDPIGKTFQFKSDYPVTVTTLIEDMPANTHLQASMFLSFAPNEKYLGQGLNSWTSVSGTATYIVAPVNGDLQRLETQLKAFAKKYIDSEEGLPADFKAGFELQPLSTIHFDSSYGGSAAVKTVDTSWLWFFAFIGVSVLALACINFINLSTAQAITRAKEIGIRKSVGAGRLVLIQHFLKEAFVLCGIASVISVATVQLLLPSINALLEKDIRFDISSSPFLWSSLIVGVVVVSLLAGSYPAFVITKFNPALALKSITSRSSGSAWIRKALVVVQFTISAGLLIALILISQQVGYILNKNLGFEKENIINVTIPHRSAKTETFANELNSLSQVKDFSFGTATPSNWGHWGTDMSLSDKNDPNRKFVTMILADENYPLFYNLKLLNGRFYTASDTAYTSNSVPEEKRIMKVMVNETLVKTLGLESNDAAIGKKFWCGMSNGNTEIIGVVADFNTASLHEAIPPTLLMQFPHVYSQAGIKITAMSDLPATIDAIKLAWEKTYPDGVFEFKFLDQQINDYYKSETRLYTLFKSFASIAMLISCLGLWGLTTFAAQQRTKEIGIRKVLGASVLGITQLLSKEFLRLTLLAVAISIPIAWYAMNEWLQNFAYHVEMSAWIFVASASVAIFIALFTVSFQSIKAAVSNPVDSLRNE